MVDAKMNLAVRACGSRFISFLITTIKRRCTRIINIIDLDIVDVPFLLYANAITMPPSNINQSRCFVVCPICRLVGNLVCNIPLSCTIANIY